MSANGQSAVFGRRKEPHTVIIARGDEIRHFTVRPWMIACFGSAVAAVVIGYLLATSYLVFRDDLIGATTARQARMQQAYEDRISALRAQVDRITSRQLLDQQLMETKVGELLARQTQLSQRHGRLGPILERAETLETISPEPQNPIPAAAPADQAKSEDHAALVGDKAIPELATLASLGNSQTPAFSHWSTRADLPADASSADRADKLFVAINQSLQAIETEQLQRVTRLADTTYENADAIKGALQAAGLPVDDDFGKDETDVGGPLVPVDRASLFDTKVKELDEALDQLDHLRKEARRLPLANPAPGRAVTSPFGVRTDPLLGTAALHSGMDFRIPLGSPARATAPGVVTKAGWNGGYGRMVEVDHGQGYTTRYAHLGRVDVAVGQAVKAGDVVGQTGSSGRSTGPHLHYEVRHDGDAIDPLRFLKVGKKVQKYL
ncbi:M23 family metallopeptidase [Mesorhizobium sp. 1M-11]|uniref:M23 family metallopeptidase n=1 Tax=Mesorhizobium sp. 1M-11 TaxID=1529006 RepID=UPI0006C73DB2|nr:M23 family metallopeptidase [Mesorhizobium sp. 1M-11]